MPIGLLLVAVLTIAIWARRKSFGYRNEGAPALMVISGTFAAFLTSGFALRTVGGGLHGLTGTWNREDLLGHMFAIVCACAAVYMCLIRLGDKESVQAFYTEWVIWPLSIAVPLLQATFTMSHARERHVAHFEDLEPDGWLATYWTLLTATIVYLLLLAVRILRSILRTPDDGRTVPHLWLLTFGVGILFTLALGCHVVTPFDMRALIWSLGYGCAALWSFTLAYSWLQRRRPLVIPDTLPALDESVGWDVRRDDDLGAPPGSGCPRDP